MKKVSLFLAAIAIVCTFSACQKEGVYHPGKKIIKIYEQPGGQSKELTEKWTWDGKNLSKISNGTNSYYRKFTYEKDRIKKITWHDGESFVFSYDGNFIKKMEYLGAAGELFSRYNFKYTKDKITTLTIEDYDDDAKNKKDKAATLRLFLPIQTVEYIVNRAQSASSTKGETHITTIEYQWDGDNVKQETLTRIEENYSFTRETTYTYDKKKNPFYNFFEQSVTSKNNTMSSETFVTEISGTTTTSGTYTYEYDITYDGNWPTEILEMYRSGSYTKRYTTYYVYED
jgi:flagellar hook assembly protein FlgD